MQKNFFFSRKKLITAGSIALLASLVSLPLRFTASKPAHDTAEKDGVTSSIIQVSADGNGEKQPKYILKEYEGRIGVYKEDSAIPAQVLDVYVFTLPEADRISLKTGITVCGENTLQKLIQDFTA